MSDEKRQEHNELWKFHDSYDNGVSCNRIVTRSQTAFNRIRNTPSDLDLFGDASRHHPPGKPHLMVTLKGEYGSIPRTIVTRSLGKHIPISEELCKEVNEYKKPQPEPKKSWYQLW